MMRVLPESRIDATGAECFVPHSVPMYGEGISMDEVGSAVGAGVGACEGAGV